MDANRKRILEMLAAGQINVDDAERLFAALEKQPSPGASAGNSETRASSSPKIWKSSSTSSRN